MAHRFVTVLACVLLLVAPLLVAAHINAVDEQEILLESIREIAQPEELDFSSLLEDSEEVDSTKKKAKEVVVFSSQLNEGAGANRRRGGHDVDVTFIKAAPTPKPMNVPAKLAPVKVAAHHVTLNTAPKHTVVVHAAGAHPWATKSHQVVITTTTINGSKPAVHENHTVDLRPLYPRTAAAAPKKRQLLKLVKRDLVEADVVNKLKAKKAAAKKAKKAKKPSVVMVASLKFHSKNTAHLTKKGKAEKVDSSKLKPVKVIGSNPTVAGKGMKPVPVLHADGSLWNPEGPKTVAVLHVTGPAVVPVKATVHFVKALGKAGSFVELNETVVTEKSADGNAKAKCDKVKGCPKKVKFHTPEYKNVSVQKKGWLVVTQYHPANMVVQHVVRVHAKVAAKKAKKQFHDVEWKNAKAALGSPKTVKMVKTLPAEVGEKRSAFSPFNVKSLASKVKGAKAPVVAATRANKNKVKKIFSPKTKAAPLKLTEEHKLMVAKMPIVEDNVNQMVKQADKLAKVPSVKVNVKSVIASVNNLLNSPVLLEVNSEADEEESEEAESPADASFVDEATEEAQEEEVAENAEADLNATYYEVSQDLATNQDNKERANKDATALDKVAMKLKDEAFKLNQRVDALARHKMAHDVDAAGPGPTGRLPTSTYRQASQVGITAERAVAKADAFKESMKQGKALGSEVRDYYGVIPHKK